MSAAQALLDKTEATDAVVADVACWALGHRHLSYADRVALARHVLANVHELEQAPGAWIVPAHVVARWTAPAAVARPASRARASRRRRPGGSSRGGRDVDRPRPADAPAASGAERTCKGCGVSFEAAVRQQRYCTPACSDRARQRRQYDRTHVRVAAAPARAVITARELAEFRADVHRKSSRRLEVWLELPSANGNRRELLAELHRLNDELADGWEAVRTAEAVAS